MKILILGPDPRTKNVRSFLEAKQHILTSTVEPITLSYTKDRNIDFIISYGYAPVLKPPVTTAYRNRIINIHPAYLPEGRGIHTNFWSFFEGRPKGVSIHFINDGIDTGEVIARKEVLLSQTDTLRTSYARLEEEVEKLFFEVWDRILEKSCSPIPQCELKRQAHLVGQPEYRNRTESERLIELLPKRWDTPVKEVEAMGAEFFLSAHFWNKHESEIGMPFTTS